MAFTKSPLQDAFGVQRLNQGGTSFLVSDKGLNADHYAGPPISLNFIDCYPVAENMGPAVQPKYRAVKRDGWVSATGTNGAVTAGTPGCKILSAEASGQLTLHFAVSNNYYMLDESTAPATLTAISACTAGHVGGGTIAVDSTNVNKVAFMDNAGVLYLWSENGTGLATTNVAGTITGISGYRNLVFLNGYLFAATKNYFYNSGPGGLLSTWSTTNFLSAEQYPDEIVWMEKHKNYLVVWGNQTTEFFYDAGIEVGSPMARQESYATRVGMHRATGNKNTAIINDDIYFVGRNEGDNIGLYRVRNFKLEPISTQYVDQWINQTAGVYTPTFQSADVFMINDQPQIGFTFLVFDGAVTYKTWTLMFDPATEQFWQLSTNGTPSTANTDIPSPLDIIGTTILRTWSQTKPALYSVTLTSGTQIYRHLVDYSLTKTASVTSILYTDNYDLGTNRWKHIGRVDAIGDYGTNVLTLSYNASRQFDSTYTDLSPTRTASTEGYGNSLSWYNLGAARSWVWKLKMVGTSSGLHEGFELEYTVGAS